MPDYFTDIDMANQIIGNIDIADKTKALKPFINISFYICNYIHHIFAWLIALFIFSVIYKINTFSGFKNIKMFSNILFLYIWVNFSYIIYGFCFFYFSIADFESPVYTELPDNLGALIPVFYMLFPFLVAIFYYPIMNFLLSLTYNMQIKNKFILYFWILCLLILICTVLLQMNSYFTYLYIIVYLYYIFWFVIILYSIRYLKDQAT